MLQTFNIFINNPLTLRAISENLFVLNIIVSCLKKENEIIQGEAAIVIINLLKLTTFKEVSVILNNSIMDSLAMFILTAQEGSQEKSFANIINSLLIEDEISELALDKAKERYWALTNHVSNYEDTGEQWTSQ